MKVSYIERTEECFVKQQQRAEDIVTDGTLDVRLLHIWSGMNPGADYYVQ